jgi:hypothetical protein
LDRVLRNLAALPDLLPAFRDEGALLLLKVEALQEKYEYNILL